MQQHQPLLQVTTNKVVPTLAMVMMLLLKQHLINVIFPTVSGLKWNILY